MSAAARRGLEAAVFLALALALHLAVLWARADDEGQAAGGAGGASSISIAGGDVETAAMVAAWDAPPDAAEQANAVEPPDASDPVNETASPPDPVRRETPPDRATPTAARPDEPAIVEQKTQSAGLPPPPASTPGMSPPRTAPEIAVAEPDGPPPRAARPATPPEAARAARPTIEDAPVEPPEEDVAAPTSAPAPRARPESNRSANPAAPEIVPPRRADPVREEKTEPRREPARPPAGLTTDDLVAEKAAPPPASRAAGAGEGAEAGGGDAAERAGRTDAGAANLAQIWGGGIRRDVEREKRYPRNVRRGGATMVAMTVTRGGALLSARIRRSSGSRGLDAAALDAVKSAAPYDQAPRALGGERFDFVLPVVFRR